MVSGSRFWENMTSINKYRWYSSECDNDFLLLSARYRVNHTAIFQFPMFLTVQSHKIYHFWGESITVPDFTISVYSAVHATICFLVLFPLIFCFWSVSRPFILRLEWYFRYEKKAKEAEKETITWTAVNRNCKIWDYETRLWCFFSNQVQ